MIFAARLLALCCVALLVTGAAAAVGLSPRKPAPPGATSDVPESIPFATTAPSAPSSAALTGGLVEPADMGGYYKASAGALSGLTANRCLAVFQSLPGQVGRASEGLETGDLYSVPQIVEVVESYAGLGAGAGFDTAAAAIAGCPDFSFDFDGSPVSGPLRPDSLTVSAQSERAWSVPFTYRGTAFELQMGLVLQDDEVLFLAWTDTDPASRSEAIMGDFPSTVTLAIGEEA